MVGRRERERVVFRKWPDIRDVPVVAALANVPFVF